MGESPRANVDVRTSTPTDRAGHFEDLARQAHAARLGTWVFVGSEALFFSGLFALYTAYRIEYPRGFGVGVMHNTVAWGSTNTLILVVSSFVLTLAVRALRAGRSRGAAMLVGLTMALGTAFALVKVGEWMHHFDEGVYPGGVGSFYEEHRDPGTKMFFTLYFCMTGLHELHVVVGVVMLGFMLVGLLRRRIGAWAPHPLEAGALYWHFVDIVWLFLWPLFYLIPGAEGR
jgi:cytochrome c oxidase subunit 3